MNDNKKAAARQAANKRPTGPAKKPSTPSRNTAAARKPAPAKKPTEAVRKRVEVEKAAVRKPVQQVAPPKKAPQPVAAAPKRPVEQPPVQKKAAVPPVLVRKAEPPVAAKKPPEPQPVVAKVVEAAVVAKKPAAPDPQAAAKKTTQRHGFKTNEFIVYPAHGVGQITAIEEQEVAGYKLELFVINFVKDKMTLRVPIPKVVSVGMRKLSEAPMVKRALETLKGRARIKRTMWSRRAQEYEAKINSGDIVAIAEVVRDLHRSESQPEQSYSERQLYEAALDRLAREISVVQRLTETEAIKEIEGALAKGPRRGPKTAEEAEEVLEEEAA